MDETKKLSDAELENVSGGGYAEESYCGKWYVSQDNPNRYVYCKKTNEDCFYTTQYFLEGEGNVRVVKTDLFRACVLMYSYTEVSISELPEAIRNIVGC